MKSTDTAKTTDELVMLIKNTVTNAGFSDIVIAVSGGIDSATSCALAVRALGNEHVYALLLPYGRLSEQGVGDATLVLDYLEIPQSNRLTTDIQSLVDPILALDPEIDVVRGGNIMARMRMILLFDQAKKRHALVVGTENKTEHLLGYFTRFGDEASDIEPLRNLYKTQIYEVASMLGIPEQIMIKAPTASLWDGQTDEGEFGFTYKEADEILSLLVDEKQSVEQIAVGALGQELVEKVKKRMDDNGFKHKLPFLP